MNSNPMQLCETDTQVTNSDGKAPKDAQVIQAILKDMGLTEYDPKVVTQLMEFLYRYVTSIVDDAKMVSNHAKKKLVDAEDIRLAVQMYNEQMAAPPPARDILIETSRVRNAQPLPVPKASSGLRLPPDRFCLTACNYKLRPRKTSQFNRAVSSGYTTVKGGIAQQTTRPIITMNQMPRIQIQPGSAAPATFTMTMNPTTLKRKAD